MEKREAVGGSSRSTKRAIYVEYVYTESKEGHCFFTKRSTRVSILFFLSYCLTPSLIYFLYPNELSGIPTSFPRWMRKANTTHTLLCVRSERGSPLLLSIHTRAGDSESVEVVRGSYTDTSRARINSRIFAQTYERLYFFLH